MAEEQKQLQEIKDTLKSVDESLKRHIVDHEKHLAEIQPIIDAYKGAGTIGTIVIWMSKVIVGFGIIVGAIYAFINYK